MTDSKFNTVMEKLKARLDNIDFEALERESYINDRQYPENFSNWYPHIKNFGVFWHSNIISNQIFTLEEVKEFSRTDDINKVNWDKLNSILKPTLDKMEPNIVYNIKNGCFSNKFNFRTCVVTKDNLVKQLWKINYMSHMYETGGHTELVVRDYIPFNPTNTFTIYEGMPLRTEVRVFYNMETKQIEYITDYWDYEYCSKSLHNITDKMIFNAFHNQFNQSDNELLKYIPNHKDEFFRATEVIKEYINTLKFDDELKGIWSIDFMYVSETRRMYLIDMARGFRSAYWDVDKLSDTSKKQFSKG